MNIKITNTATIAKELVLRHDGDNLNPFEVLRLAPNATITVPVALLGDTHLPLAFERVVA